jgi:hypothetical protein
MKPMAHLPDEDLLDPTRAEQDHLRACAPCRERRAAQDHVRTAIKGLERAAPPTAAALALLEKAARRPSFVGALGRFANRATLRHWIALPAAAVIAVTAVLLFVRGRGTGATLPAPLRDELVLDHLHYAPIAEPAQIASSDPKVVAAALEQRLGRPVVVPSWEATTLIGGRSCHIRSEWVPLVLYERAGRRISLFAISDVKVSGSSCERAEGGVSICASPRAGGGAFVAVSNLPPHEVARLLGQVNGS